MEKPANYHFRPGQATDVSINKPGWVSELRPFTFTALNDDPYLEFTIKCYPERKGVTNELKNIIAGDELIIRPPWGAIEYKDEGYFIAGGAGITPFIAILRQLNKDGRLGKNKLFFSNKTSGDIIYEQELLAMLGDNVVFILTQDSMGKYVHDFIDDIFLENHVEDFNRNFYLCGPDKMTANVSQILISHGSKPDTVIFEK